MILYIVLAFLAGLLIGSFLNVCVFRLPRDLSVVAPRSFCPHCEKQIAWYDNIPVVSFLLLQGKCRYCRERIPARYPLVELGTGAAFALCVAARGLTLPAIDYAIFSAIMITLIATDAEERILPDEFTLGGTAIGLIFSWFVYLDPGIAGFFAQPHWGRAGASLADAASGAGILSGLTWSVRWVHQKIRKREGMGLGDVKMIACIGAFLGLPDGLLAFIVASFFGTIGGVIYALVTKKEISTYELPFGSFLGASALLVAIWRHVISVWLVH